MCPRMMRKESAPEEDQEMLMRPMRQETMHHPIETLSRCADAAHSAPQVWMADMREADLSIRIQNNIEQNGLDLNPDSLSGRFVRIVRSLETE